MYSPETSDVRQAVLDIVARLSGRTAGEIAGTSKLADDLGIDSIRLLELLAALEEHFRFELELDDLQPELFQSVETLLQFMERRIPA